MHQLLLLPLWLTKLLSFILPEKRSRPELVEIYGIEEDCLDQNRSNGEKYD